MVNYYTMISSFIPGWTASARDMNAMQDNIGQSLDQLIIDGFGKKFVLSPEENAFLLSPVANANDAIIDQKNTNGDSWKSLEQLYLIQQIDTQKSSITNITLQFKNETNTSCNVTVKLSNGITQLSTIPFLKTVSIPVTPGTNEYSLPINIDHLPAIPLFLTIERTNIAGISVLYDSTGGYNSSLAESDNDSVYNEIGADLWFKVGYGSATTFNINKSLAMMLGEKIQPLDTHITLDPGSNYGNRIDIVCLTPEGFYEAISGDVANVPEIPESEIPSSYLRLAKVYVPKNVNSALLMNVTQDDSLGAYRLRSHDERIRRLEKEANWMMVYNAPKRIKYNLIGDTFKDTSASIGIADTYDETVGGYTISDTVSKKQTWTLKDNTGIDLTKTTLDHTDLTNGVAKLKKTTTSTKIKSQQHFPQDMSDYRPVTEIGSFYHEITIGKRSHYIGTFVYNKKGGLLMQTQVGHFWYKNASHVQIAVFEQSGSNLNLMEISDKRALSPHTMPNKNTSQVMTCEFSGTTWLDPGWYLLLVIFHPISGKNGNTTEYIFKPYRKDRNIVVPTIAEGAHPYKDRSYDLLVSGLYPPNKSIKINGNSGMYSIEESQNGAPATLTLLTEKDGVQISSGVIQSNITETEFIINSVTMDVNISLPKGSSYKLEVSNDGGNNFYRMYGSNFQFPDNGDKFVWRITMNPGSNNSSPQIKYSSSKGYAISATLATSGDNNSGCLVTTSFDGNQVIQSALRSDTNDFSHWEWLTVYANSPITEQDEIDMGKTLRVNLENASTVDSNGRPVFKKIISDLRLSDMYHGSVDYSNYEAAYEDDEYNFYLDVDEDVMGKTVLLDSMSSTGTSSQDTQVVVSSLVDTVSDSALNASSIQVNQLVMSNTDTGVLMYKQENLDLSNYNYLSCLIKTNGILSQGELQLILSTTSDESGKIDAYNFPALKGTEGYVQVIFKLRNPILLTSVPYFLIKTTKGNTGVQTVKIGRIEGIGTESYPFYGKYIRARICMTRENIKDSSPSVREIRLIPIID